MSRTSNLRRQHDAALAIVGEIVAATDAMGAKPGRAEALPVTMLLARLTGILRIHFAQEDRHLYPSLMASGLGGVAATARRFFEEMGQIGPIFGAFVQKWQAVEAITGDPAGFRAESAALWAALGDRIERENSELYPLADAQSNEGVPLRAA